MKKPVLNDSESVNNLKTPSSTKNITVTTFLSNYNKKLNIQDNTLGQQYASSAKHQMETPPSKE